MVPMYTLPSGATTGLAPGATRPTGVISLGDTAGAVSTLAKPVLALLPWAVSQAS